mmetsp:Transcript_45754/g.147329  ORF Transcript_45754/g.147329 Transcript_45754/m.147329 type:complete len:233 (-) Transcript_45754:120-818(-)
MAHRNKTARNSATCDESHDAAVLEWIDGDGWEGVPSVAQEFHPDVLATEDAHPLRGGGSRGGDDLACLIGTFLDPKGAMGLSLASRRLHNLCRGDAGWRKATRPFYVQSAVLSLSKEEFGEALASADIAIAIDPTMADGHSSRAHALRGLGRRQEAAQALQEAVARAGWSPTFVVNTSITCAYAEKEDAKEAGCRWNPAAKTWYAPQGMDKSKLMEANAKGRWMPWGEKHLA